MYAKSPRRRHVRTARLVVAFVSWALAGAATAMTLGLPLARIDAVSTLVALLCGAGAHLVRSLLVITRRIFRRWGLIVTLLVAAAGAACISSTPAHPCP